MAVRSGTACMVTLVFAAGCMRQSADKTAYPFPQKPAYTGENRFVAELFDPKQARMLLEGKERDRWQKPAQLVEALKLKRGDSVADIGTGSGYLLPYLSRAVGPRGRVYAEEIQSEFMPSLRARAKQLGNVDVILGTATDPQLPGGKLDAIVMLTVYHEVKDPVKFLTTLRNIAKPTTKLAVIDFDARRRGEHPAPVVHEVPEDAVVAEAAQAGWKLTARHEFLGSQFYLVLTPTP